MDEGLTEITVKLNGIILRKAELENNFEKIYLKVFEKMVEIEEFEGEELLEIFGDLGG